MLGTAKALIVLFLSFFFQTFVLNYFVGVVGRLCPKVTYTFSVVHKLLSLNTLKKVGIFL